MGLSLCLIFQWNSNFLWPCCLEKAVMLQGKSVPDPVSLPHHISIIRATHTHLIISHFPCVAGVLSWIFWGLHWRNSGTFDSTDSHLTTPRPRRADDTRWWWKHIDPRPKKKGSEICSKTITHSGDLLFK